MDIRCKQLNCKYNNNYRCDAKQIEINNNICKVCIKEKENFPQNHIFEDPQPKYAPYRAVEKMHIECHSDCLFNIEGLCKANGIFINNLKDPICMTYLKK